MKAISFPLTKGAVIFLKPPSLLLLSFAPIPANLDQGPLPPTLGGLQAPCLLLLPSRGRAAHCHPCRRHCRPEFLWMQLWPEDAGLPCSRAGQGTRYCKELLQAPGRPPLGGSAQGCPCPARPFRGNPTREALPASPHPLESWAGGAAERTCPDTRCLPVGHQQKGPRGCFSETKTQFTCCQTQRLNHDRAHSCGSE